MSSLRDPGLGPIVGHTTESSCRLWIRAGDPEDSGANLSSERRTVGVVAVVKKNDRAIADPPVYYFRMHREYDRTGSALGLDQRRVDVDGRAGIGKLVVISGKWVRAHEFFSDRALRHH